MRPAGLFFQPATMQKTPTVERFDGVDLGYLPNADSLGLRSDFKRRHDGGGRRIRKRRRGCLNHCEPLPSETTQEKVSDEAAIGHVQTLRRGYKPTEIPWLALKHRP